MSRQRRLISIVGVSAWNGIPIEDRGMGAYQRLLAHLADDIERSVEMTLFFGAKKLPNYHKDHVEHHLLVPDSDEAVIAAKAIQEVTRRAGHACIFNEEQDRIRGLDPYDSTKFVRHGLPSLLERIRKIVEFEFPNDPNDPTVLVNVTSGYKAITPYTSAMAFLYRLPLIYKYERSPAILVMRPLPVELDTRIVEACYETFAQLRHGASVAEWQDSEEYRKLLRLGYIDEVDDVCALNGTGSLLLFAFERDAVVVDITQEAKEAVMNSVELGDRIFKFARDHQLRSNKTELKSDHMVFDDGNNPYRIFYENGTVPRIYGAYANHDVYERQLRKPKTNHYVYERVKIVRRRDAYAVEQLLSPGRIV
ncbi:hypothetical protein [Alicyclobacillus mali (ex Roth et al. 2021)]|uniref:hypothetical protein n=1 Tax=Alicyclobacillus mali (ex Roth et al. 2021) TaxID=1123961 RepID=UPI0023EF95B1|nr:hypothetical protein [Alicyclobacillus mali (ex Roth et al. 2021)]